MIEDKILKTIRDCDMLGNDGQTKVIVAFSGGVDSTALIHVLNSLKGKLNIKLYAAHLNHKIRKRDGGLDAAFARKTAKKLRIPCIVEEFDVPSFAKQNRLNLEDAARRVRYEFLERAAAKVGADRIALAHNADDNIETLLMRLIRGTGMKGMEGIPPVRDKIIRPMIGLFRVEIERYLRSKKITPRIDRSNFETKYLRNRIRRDLIPKLVSYNSNIKELLLQTISSASVIQGFVELKAREALKGMVLLKSAGEIRLDIKKLLDTDPALKGEVLRLAIEHVKKDLVDISFVHIEDILGQLRKKRAEIDLPGIYAHVNRGALSIANTRPAKAKDHPFMHKLEIPGEVRDEGEGFIVEADVLPSVAASDLRAKDPYQAYLDYDKISKPLIVRNRRAGDVFSPFGLKGRKKLQDIFVDEKVDIDKRESIPIIEDGKRIVWVVGYRMSEDAKVTPGTKKVVKLSAKNIR
jgi:tRNA(Ile)-lysidine synthase